MPCARRRHRRRTPLARGSGEVQGLTSYHNPARVGELAARLTAGRFDVVHGTHGYFAGTFSRLALLPGTGTCGHPPHPHDRFLRFKARNGGSNPY